ncbi:hypothetical protein M8J77_015037 [Diaphorina citri]|nr:hypothetical protein M8J77_015037 [Diaphorina citri]
MTKLQAICFHLLYELSDEPKRKEFLDDLFSFNQKKDELKNAIRQEIYDIPREMLERVMTNFKERSDVCIQNEGRHLSSVVFHT